MRPLSPEWTAAISDAGITTAMLARFDFTSESVFVWTGAHSLAVSGTGDALLDGNTYDPLVAGVVVNIGENAFSYSGSEAMSVSLAIPSSPHSAIASASVFPQEYQGRSATFWRAIMITPAMPGSPAIWQFRRVRTGTMDQVSIQHNGNAHIFTLTVEAHAARISQATGKTYLDQKKLDPTDLSQTYAVAIANGKPAPSSSTAGAVGVGAGGMNLGDRQYVQQN